jgi:hypothetical protein
LKPPAGSIRIGKMISGRAGTVLFEGKQLAPRGYDHFE